MMVGLVVTSLPSLQIVKETNILCRHTAATLKLYVYSLHLLLPGQILLVFSWNLVTLTEHFNTTRYSCSYLIHTTSHNESDYFPLTCA